METNDPKSVEQRIKLARNEKDHSVEKLASLSG